MHHILVLVRLAGFRIDAVAGQDNAVVAQQLTIFVIGQAVAFTLIQRLKALARLHGHHIGGAINLAAQLRVNQGVKRPILVGSPQVDTARHQRCAVAHRHTVVGLQIGGSRLVEQRHRFAVGIVERTDDGAIGHGVFIDIIPAVDGAILLPFFHRDSRTIRAPNLGKRVHIGSRKVDNLVLVAGQVQADLHAIVLALCDVVGHNGLDTLVGHHARVDGHVVGTRRGSERRGKDLVPTVDVVIGEVQVEPCAQAQVEAQLVGALALWFQFQRRHGGRQSGRKLVTEGTCIIGVSQLVGFGIAGGLCPRTSQFQVVDRSPIPILEGRSRDETQSGRRIEIGVVVDGQGRRPIVATRHIKEQPIAITEVEEGIQRIDLLFPPRFAKGALRGVGVVVNRIEIGVSPSAGGAVDAIAIAVILLATSRETHIELRAENLVLVSRKQEIHVAGHRA